MKNIKILLIILIIVIIGSKNVYAKTANPLYVKINNNYLYTSGAFQTGGQITYNVYPSGTANISVCISPVNYNRSERMEYATIDICSNGSNTYSLLSGVGYAEVIGSIEYTNNKCITTSGYQGYINRVYVHLLDTEVPSGGADFDWTCFNLGQTSIANYTSLNRLIDVQLNSDSTYQNDYNQQLIINNQTNQTNAINNQTNAINNQTNAINNQTNAINDINNQDIDNTTKQDVNTNTVDNTQQAEEDLLNIASNTNMTIVDVGIDTTSSNKIWEIITRILNTNAKVMQMFISILSVGIIKLILRR